MSTLQVSIEQYKRLPVLADSETCSGKVYIVTGANNGLGLETARHLVRCSAARVILAVRNITAGEKAKSDIERSTGRKGVAQVWHLDLASFASVQAFVNKATADLERVDSLIENAGVAIDKWETSEGTETSMTVNVISTMLLGVLIMPKLMESARQFGIKPRLVFLVSALGFTAEDELEKSGKVNLFDGINDPKRADMDQRYSLTKLVEMYAVREFAALFPAERTGVIINMVAPGLCSTGLAHDTRTWTRTWIAVVRAMLARTAEQGSRTILHGVVADQESHGKLLSGCKIKDYWIPKWMINEDGQRTQKQIWKELVTRMEEVQTGCIPHSL
ncbi:Short-chain dehydrogenase [Pleurostoma richardsiae]|uniref:Short-chain dehydrogenase n=1 Tax=Pleurostoma richardsiae TaxID=41990 RepID=A0AA38R9E6_9PEZI|nr:Short-chain dehydrogenase [Pleurostoma richardsiae]